MGTITVSNLSKAYKQYPSRWARLAEWLIPFYPKRHTLKWILQEINFTVLPGEAVGIIGVNGAGKSTLLKMITGTTVPTTGSVHMSGRVAAMLELGMGFHPDFTGRQNAFMAGQLLGYTPEEIEKLMPEIEAFAEIGAYIDEPVRVYSSGMQMRLAFSVATAVRPDVLIVDEALSVGDTYFVHKSFARIKGYREQGTTLLIVSHDQSAIQAICDKAILINRGKIDMIGAPSEVMDHYHSLNLVKINESYHENNSTSASKEETESDTHEASIESVTLINSAGIKTEQLEVGEIATIVIETKINCELERLVIGYGIKDRLGQVVYGTNTNQKSLEIKNQKKDSQIKLEAKFRANLGPGTYSIQAAAMDLDDNSIYKNYHWVDFAVVFTVINSKQPDFTGIAWLNPEIKLERK
jgi:lipopolysaccharide transport system ATP-binding protein